MVRPHPALITAMLPRPPRRVISHLRFPRLSNHREGKSACSLLHLEWDNIVSPLRTLHRFVLANTESLHEKITELSLRVRSLEDALRVAHGNFNNDIHPLLSDDLLKIKNPLEREVVAQPQRPQEEEDTLDAVGSL